MTDQPLTPLKCKTCVHYVREGDGFGSCLSPTIERGYLNPDDRPSKSHHALVEDDEGWGIQVGEDFGCVNHEAKL